MSIRGHFPPKEQEGFTNLQVKMETSLVEEVKACMKVDGISWNDLLTACFKAYLDESKEQSVTIPPGTDNSGVQFVSKAIGFVVLMGLAESSVSQVVVDIGEFFV